MALNFNINIRINQGNSGRSLRTLERRLSSIERISMRLGGTFSGSGSGSLTGSIRRTNTAAGRLQGGLGLLIGRFTRLGAVVGTLSAAFTIGARAALSYDRAFREVSTLVDTTTFDLELLNDEIQRQSVLFGQDSATGARATYQIISAGAKDAADAVNLLNQANLLAAAGVTDVETASRLLLPTLNAYGREYERSAEFSDIFFATVREGITTIPELSQHIGTATPVASQLGIELAEVGAAMATVTSAGINTGNASVALRGILVSILKPSRDTQNLARELGIEFNSTALRAQGLSGFLMMVSEAVGDNNDALARLFPQARQLPALLALMAEGGETFAETLDRVSNSIGATEEAAAITAQGLEQQFLVVWQQVVDFLQDILTPTLETVLDLLNAIGVQTIPSGLQAISIARNLGIDFGQLRVTSLPESAQDEILEQISRVRDLREELARARQEAVSAPGRFRPGSPGERNLAGLADNLNIRERRLQNLIASLTAEFATETGETATTAAEDTGTTTTTTTTPTASNLSTFDDFLDGFLQVQLERLRQGQIRGPGNRFSELVQQTEEEQRLARLRGANVTGLRISRNPFDTQRTDDPLGTLAEINAQQLEQVNQGIRNFSDQIGGNLVNNLQQAVDGTQSFGDALTNFFTQTLSQIAGQQLQQGASSLLSGFIGNAVGGQSGGLLASFFGSFANGGSFIVPGGPGQRRLAIAEVHGQEQGIFLNQQQQRALSQPQVVQQQPPVVIVQNDPRDDRVVLASNYSANIIRVRAERNRVYTERANIV